MKIGDLWQSIEKEKEEKNLHFLFVVVGGKIVQVAHTILLFC